MTDTNPQHAGGNRTESDGVSYRGIVVFVVILAATTFICEGIVVGLFKYFDAQQATAGPVRAPLSMPAGTLPPPPNLLTDERGNLQRFRASEDEILKTYAWQDKNAGVVRLPIDRAKALVLERGFPVAGETPAPSAKAEVKKAAVKK